MCVIVSGELKRLGLRSLGDLLGPRGMRPLTLIVQIQEVASLDSGRDHVVQQRNQNTNQRRHETQDQQHLAQQSRYHLRSVTEC